MKTTCLYAMLVFLASGLGVALEGSAQIPAPTELNKNIKTIPLDVPTKVIQKAKVSLPSVGGDAKSLVESLVRHYKLDKSPTKNPSLVFGANEINYWKSKRLDRQTLRLEFAARRIILDAADEQNVPIRDQDMLSKAAREVIPLLQEGSKVSRDQTARLNTPRIICGSEVGERSEDLIAKAWAALKPGEGGMKPNFEKALACAQVTIDSYEEDAVEQQAARLEKRDCNVPPSPEEKEKTTYFRSNYALSDIAAAWFIRGQVFEQQGKCPEAKEAYKVIAGKYSCAWIWDPPKEKREGLFWSAKKGAEKQLKMLESYDVCP